MVGPNGCGKSTLLGLLPRFYDPDHGAVLVDGVNLRTASLRSLRKQIGLVTQDTVLFNDTIFANIAYGKPGATREEVEAAARKAFAHEFIVLKPAGYDEQVGDFGSQLSGGQKQRIALARAILRDPRILILDEFTSQIDVESEFKIQQALKEFVQRPDDVPHHPPDEYSRAGRPDRGHGPRPIVAVGTHLELLRVARRTSDSTRPRSSGQTRDRRKTNRHDGRLNESTPPPPGSIATAGTRPPEPVASFSPGSPYSDRGHSPRTPSRRCRRPPRIRSRF